jgi:hypothetical protein
MSDVHPVHAAPRPLLELLSRAAIALFDPIDPAPPRAAPGARPCVRCYAAFEAPTYQRRRLRIPGLVDADLPAPAGPPVRATVGSTRPVPPPRA